MSVSHGDRAGRLFLEALRLDLEPLDQVRRTVRAALALEAGGFLLFGARADEASRLVEAILAETDRPLWLAADVERGVGQHVRGLATFPPPAALAAHPEPEAGLIYAIARDVTDLVRERKEAQDRIEYLQDRLEKAEAKLRGDP